MSKKNPAKKPNAKSKKSQPVADDAEAATTNRDRIARSYGHGSPAPVAESTAAVQDATNASAVQDDTDTEKPVASDSDVAVESGSDHVAPNDSVPKTAPNIHSDSQEQKNMAETRTLSFMKLSKSSKYALYKGLRTVTRLSVTDFPDPENPPKTLEVSGELAGAREVLTKEQRAERRKNAPKPTLAEQIAKREKALARLKAKAEKEAVPA